MMILGGLLAVWGLAVLLFARPLHTSWRDMIRSMRRAGVTDSIWGTEFLASEKGLRWMRRAGGAVLAAGLALVAVGVVRALF